ncbi:hypothetical protein R3I94_002487 [Phoxinus phoxinus]
MHGVSLLHFVSAPHLIGGIPSCWSSLILTPEDLILPYGCWGCCSSRGHEPTPGEDPPSEVNSPGVEKAEWLNKVVKRLWPNAA